MPRSPETPHKRHVVARAPAKNMRSRRSSLCFSSSSACDRTRDSAQNEAWNDTRNSTWNGTWNGVWNSMRNAMRNGARNGAQSDTRRRRHRRSAADEAGRFTRSKPSHKNTTSTHRSIDAKSTVASALSRGRTGQGTRKSTK